MLFSAPFSKAIKLLQAIDVVLLRAPERYFCLKSSEVLVNTGSDNYSQLLVFVTNKVCDSKKSGLVLTD